MELTPTERAKAIGWSVDLPDDAYGIECLCVAMHIICACPCHKEDEQA